MEHPFSVVLASSGLLLSLACYLPMASISFPFLELAFFGL